MDSALLAYDLPSFLVYLPEKFSSIEQESYIEKILMDYPKNRLGFNQYFKDRFEEKTWEEIYELIRTNKINSNEEHKL